MICHRGLLKDSSFIVDVWDVQWWFMKMIMLERLLISFDTVTLSNSTRIMVGIYLTDTAHWVNVTVYIAICSYVHTFLQTENTHM